MNLADIHKSIATTVKNEFGMPCYSRDTSEGAKKPCFFLELNSDSIARDTKYYDNYIVQIELTYVSTKRDDETFYTILDKMKNLYLHYIKVGNRTLHVTNFDYNYIGDNDEQIAFQIETRFKDTMVKEPTGDMMGDFDLKIEGRKV